MKIKQGFTLVELIVVVTIIAVLTTVALISFSGTNKKARDGRRIADLQKVAIALEMARQVGGTYPPSNGSNQPTGITTYLQTWPTDPKGYRYYYVSPPPLSDAYHYILQASVEDLGSTTTITTNGNCGTGVSCNFQITNP